ncbi:MAG: hypothetical protein ACRDRL_22195 [Sciscionella sp.]
MAGLLGSRPAGRSHKSASSDDSVNASADSTPKSRGSSAPESPCGIASASCAQKVNLIAITASTTARSARSDTESAGSPAASPVGGAATDGCTPGSWLRVDTRPSCTAIRPEVTASRERRAAVGERRGRSRRRARLLGRVDKAGGAGTRPLSTAGRLFGTPEY